MAGSSGMLVWLDLRGNRDVTIRSGVFDAKILLVVYERVEHD